jgi:hypothetical protein
MRPALGILIIMALNFCSCAQFSRNSADPSPLSGERAMEHVRAQVAFGPRPPGSQALQKCREYIAGQMKSVGYEIEEDAFMAQTPYGPIRMNNLIARRGKGNKSAIVLATHYDTKLMEGKNFVGANDAGSSTGLLIELARILAGKKDSKDPCDYWFLFWMAKKLLWNGAPLIAPMEAGIWLSDGKARGLRPKFESWLCSI